MSSGPPRTKSGHALNPLVFHNVRIEWAEAETPWNYFQLMYVGQGLARVVSTPHPKTKEHPTPMDFWVPLSEIAKIHDLQ